MVAKSRIMIPAPLTADKERRRAASRKSPWMAPSKIGKEQPPFRNHDTSAVLPPAGVIGCTNHNRCGCICRTKSGPAIADGICKTSFQIKAAGPVLSEPELRAAVRGLRLTAAEPAPPPRTGGLFGNSDRRLGWRRFDRFLRRGSVPNKKSFPRHPNGYVAMLKILLFDTRPPTNVPLEEPESLSTTALSLTNNLAMRSGNARIIDFEIIGVAPAKKLCPA
jgi:hypothetical protein